MPIKRLGKRLVWIGLLFVVIVLATFTAIRVNAQDYTLGELSQRLTNKGVPLASLTVASRVPFVIHITLRTQSQTGELLPDDLYYAQVARRAATLNYRHGQRLGGYELDIINAKSESIKWEAVYLYADEESQRLGSLAPSRLSDADTESLVREAFTQPGLTLNKLTVTTDQALGDAAQEVRAWFSVPDLAAANQYLVPFVVQVRPILEKINQEHGTRLALCWINVVDDKRTMLLVNVWDLEAGPETSISAPGLEAWYPVPAPDAFLPTATPDSLRDAPGYPGPQLTPTAAPYP